LGHASALLLLLLLLHVGYDVPLSSARESTKQAIKPAGTTPGAAAPDPRPVQVDSLEHHAPLLLLLRQLPALTQRFTILCVHAITQSTAADDVRGALRRARIPTRAVLPEQMLCARPTHSLLRALLHMLHQSCRRPACTAAGGGGGGVACDRQWW
jgi:hypothetical protein